MKKYIFILIASVVILQFSCVEPIEVKSEDYIQLIVVEGEISNLPGPYRVSLHYNAQFPDDPNKFKAGKEITDATLTIFELETGKSSGFAHVGKGVYETSDLSFTGIIGNTYHIEIQHNYKTYQSKPSVIMPVPEIDSLYSEYDSLSEALYVYLDFQDFETRGNKYRWKWEGYKKILTSLPGPPNYPDTFDCCTECYMHDMGRTFLTYQDSYTNGNAVKRQKIMQVPLNNSTDYLVEVQQYGITNEEYEYLGLLKSHVETRGGLFDPLPFNIEGNVYDVNEPSQIALGYFSTVSVSESHIQIKRRPYFPYPVIISQTDCRTIPYAFVDVPDNWK